MILARVKKVPGAFLEILLTVVMGVLVLDVVWQVLTRYVFTKPYLYLLDRFVGQEPLWVGTLLARLEFLFQPRWTEELATFLMIWVGMLGASVALNRGAHLGIDYFVGKLPARVRAWIEVVVFAAIGLFSLFVLLIGGGLLTRTMLQGGQVSPAMGLKMGYVYLALPISGFFLVFYSVELLIERIVTVARGEVGFQHAIDSLKPPAEGQDDVSHEVDG
jgi:TRAP-type C4-dicarboxylate transport system permease small subunit